MGSIQYFVGIDVSKDVLETGIRPTEEEWVHANDVSGIQALTDRLVKLCPELVVLEATGGYERAAAVALAEADVRVAVVNARQVRDFAKCTGQLAKTDKIDKHVIAHFGEAIKPAPRPLPDKVARYRDALMTRRGQVVDMLVQEKNHLSTAHPEVAQRIREQIEHLEGSIQQLDADLAKSIGDDPVAARKRKVLCSAKGVGVITANVLLTQLPEIGQISGREIAKLVGVAPLNDQSGTHDGRRKIWGGRGDLRMALYMPTLAAIRSNPVIRAMYKRLTARGKPHKLALIACMRKQLTILNAMVRDDRLWVTG